MTGRQTGAAQLSPPKERAHTAGGWSPGLDSSSRPPSHPAYRTVTYLGACHPYSREGCCGFSPHSQGKQSLPSADSLVGVHYSRAPPRLSRWRRQNITIFSPIPAISSKLRLTEGRVFYIISYTIERSGYAGCSKPAVLHFRVGVGLTSDAWRAS